MKKFNVFTFFLIIASLFIILTNWQICLSDGCSFVPQQPVCQDGNCVNENVSDHFSERAGIFAAVIHNNGTLLLAIILLVIAIIFSTNQKSRLSQINNKAKIVSQKFALAHSRLDFLFSKGLLHPKIY